MRLDLNGINSIIKTVLTRYNNSYPLMEHYKNIIYVGLEVRCKSKNIKVDSDIISSYSHDIYSTLKMHISHVLSVQVRHEPVLCPSNL